MKKLKFLFIISLYVTCHQKNNPTIISPLINVDAEIQLWKKELLQQHILGNSCNPLAHNSQQWIQDNPNTLDGFPIDKTYINIIYGDFDKDFKQDVLLFFCSINCSGHNGSSPYFAKIIYANGTTNSQVMDDIIGAIGKQIFELQKKHPNFKSITQNYLNTNITIKYDSLIRGDYYLYTSTDKHCCPSYKGQYTYNISNRIATIQIQKLLK